jgi:hypothetical protein
MNIGREMRPQARAEGIVVQTLPDEVLVYDLERHQAHCLNSTAALVWKYCDGHTTVAQMVHILQRDLQTPLSDDVVRLALRQLRQAHLLTESGEAVANGHKVSRRELVRRLGWATAMALPLVTSIVAPTASEAASCLSSGSSCTTGAQCCSGVCVGFLCT